MWGLAFLRVCVCLCVCGCMCVCVCGGRVRSTALHVESVKRVTVGAVCVYVCVCVLHLLLCRTFGCFRSVCVCIYLGKVSPDGPVTHAGSVYTTCVIILLYFVGLDLSSGVCVCVL